MPDGSRARFRRPVALVAAIAALVVALTAALALAAAPGGPAPVTPKQGKMFARGSKITFRVRDRSSYARRYGVFLTVAARKVVRHEELQMPKGNAPGDFARMRRGKNGIYSYTPPRYTFPSWYRVRPGRYYWQAHHINCAFHGPTDCHYVGKIRSFRVR
jgi:hypothetical protein